MAEENENDKGKLVPAESETETTNIPSANAPDPEALSPENVNSADKQADKAPEGKAGKAAKGSPKQAEATQPPANPSAGNADEKKAVEAKQKPAAAKKEKPPALEDKPFSEFVQEHYIPALGKALKERGIGDLELKLVNEKIPVVGMSQEPPCWQVVGTWKDKQRQFRVYFFKEDISGQRAFSFTSNASKASTLEPFLIDERRVNLDLLVFGVFQRLNAQKWLALN